MNNFLEFVLNNIGNIIVVVVVLVFLIILFKKDKKTLYRILLVLVTQAEKNIKGDKKGQERLNEVFCKVYDYLPSLIRWFVSKEMLKDWIEQALKQAKEYWEKYPELLDEEVDTEKILKLK